MRARKTLAVLALAAAALLAGSVTMGTAMAKQESAAKPAKSAARKVVALRGNAKMINTAGGVGELTVEYTPELNTFASNKVTIFGDVKHPHGKADTVLTIKTYSNHRVVNTHIRTMSSNPKRVNNITIFQDGLYLNHTAAVESKITKTVITITTGRQKSTRTVYFN